METTDWKALIDKSLKESVQTAEEKITSRSAIHEWLQDASYEAAVGTQGVSDRTGMEAYHQLSKEFEARFGSLFEAVEAVTHGCGHVTLDWQPGDPRRTRVRIDFRQEFPIHVYRHFDQLSEAAVNRFLTRLDDHLPKGAPYPKKPHRVGGIISYADVCAPVRLTEAATSEDRRRQFLTIYKDGEEYRRDIPFEEAAQHLASFIHSAARGREAS